MRNILLLLGILILTGLIGILLQFSKRFGSATPMETISLTAADGVGISADYYSGKTPAGAVLIHMMPATKESWRDFATRLRDAHGWHLVAIDLRGHGASAGGPDGYKTFSDAEHQAGVRDIDAAVRYLTEQGIPASAIALIGASIGANLALAYAREHPEIGQIVLLSPGLDYRGIRTEPLVPNLTAGQRVLFVTAKDDIRSGGNNADMNQRLYGLVPDGVEKKLIVYNAAGHGTDMFGKESPDLTEEILTWLR